MAAEWLGDRELAERLVTVLKEGEEYDFNRLVHLVRPASQQELRLLLGWLVQSGRLHLIYRVESPERHGGIEDFDSLDEIPERIFDWRADREVEVTPDNLRALYEIESAHA